MKDFLAAIAEATDDPAPYLVYADWLQAQADPRGDLIALQHQLVEDPTNDELLIAEAALFTANAAEWFGAKHPNHDPYAERIEESPHRQDRLGWPLGGWQFGYFMTWWRWGFIQRMGFFPGYYTEDVDERGAGEACVKILEALLETEWARFVEWIEIGDLWSDYENSMGPELGAATEVITDSPCAANLRVIDFMGGEHDVSGVSGSASSIWRKCPRLQMLGMFGNDLSFGKIQHDQLKKLTVHSGGFPREAVRELAAAVLPSCEHLHIMLGSRDYGGNSTIEDLRPLLNTETLPKVTALGLCNSDYQGEIVQALAGSMLLKQVTDLNLSMGTLDDESAQPLLDSDAFQHLEKLDVSQNYLTIDFLAELKKTHKNVVHERQRDPARHRYCVVGE